MTIVITMAGFGTRFKKAGYPMPKYQITAHGKTLFEWSMESLADFRRPEDTYLFILRREDRAADFIREKCLAMGIGRIQIIELDEMTDGQATTAMLGAAYWDKESPLLVYNIDTYVEAGQMRPEQFCGDGFIPCFCGEGDHWSFVRLSEDGRAAEVREKVHISDYCTIGAYYFKTCGLYEALYEEYYHEEDHMEKGEKYIAPLYNYLIQKGNEVQISVIEKERIHVLGTPEELDYFKENYKK